MDSLFPVSLALLSLTALLPAQLSGNYTIDPAGGPGIYVTFQDAVNAAVTSGVSGPVTFVVTPGTYTESVSIVHIPGASATNTVTFLALIPGHVHMVGATTHTFRFSGNTTARTGWVVFDGLDFVSAPGRAIFATAFTDGCEVRNCIFGPNHRASASSGFYDALIEVTGGTVLLTTDIGWNVHHNQFTFTDTVSPRQGWGIVMWQCGGWTIHHNVCNLNGCNIAIYMTNENRRLDTVYNNVFFGSLNSTGGQYTVIKADSANYDNDFVNNSFYVTMPGQGLGSIIASDGITGIGTVPTTTNRIRGNVFHLTGVGTCIDQDTPPGSPLPDPFFSDHNVFHAPNGSIGRLGNSDFTTLAAWQAATGQDAASVQADPLYRNVASNPPDLRIRPGSPAKDLALLTPAYVTTDLLGRPRDALPDAGAYEGTSFIATYGQGCPGTGSLVPSLTHSAFVGLGLPVSINLENALANTVAVSIVGFSRTMYGTTPLPFDLGGGCFVLASPDSTGFTVTSGTGTASTGLFVPNDSNLLGLELFWQWAVVDAGSPSPFGIAMSNAAEMQL